MGDFTKEELAKIKAKEAKWKAEGDAKSAAKDAELVEKVKDKLGIGRPGSAPAETDTMGNVTGMKKGGSVKSKCPIDGIALRGKTKA